MSDKYNRSSEERRYLSTLNPNQRSLYNARQQHQFRDSIGGDRSNYKF